MSTDTDTRAPEGWSNPYFEAVAGGVTVGQCRGDYTNDRAYELNHRREDLVQEYAWAIPNYEAIATIVDHAPILEVGAGGGYWAHLCRYFDCHVLSTDPEPWPNAEAWYPVWKASAQDIAAEYPERTLLLVWPSYGESWATEALGMYGSAGGETCIYVGEGRGGCTADDRFHQMLHEEWTLKETVAIPTYLGIHDRLEVWSR